MTTNRQSRSSRGAGWYRGAWQALLLEIILVALVALVWALLAPQTIAMSEKYYGRSI